MKSVLQKKKNYSIARNVARMNHSDELHFFSFPEMTCIVSKFQLFKRNELINSNGN